MTPERYRIFDSFAEGVQILSPEGRYIYLNDAVAVQGKRLKSELLGSTIVKEYPGIEQTEVFKRIQQCIKEQSRQILMNEFVYPDKSVGYFMLRIDPVEEGVLIISTDITRLRDAERHEITKSSDAYYKTLIETSSDVITLFDKLRNVIYRSPAAEKVLGYSAEEFKGRSGFDLVHPDDREAADNTFNTVLNSPDKIEHVQYRLQHKNGHYVSIEGTCKNLLNDKSVNAIIFTYHDITDKVNAIKDLDKYNHEITLLNKINDHILRVEDEGELLRCVCECIVESGGYKLSWVAFRPEEDDPEQLVIPKFACGNVDYVKGIKVSLSDPVLSKGPTATALLTGNKVITNNVTTSSLFKPWLEKALMHGLVASIVLPLTFSHETAALNIYSGKADAFDEDEVKTLERVASNVSRAINSIRTRRDKEKAQYELGERVKELSTIYHLNRILQDTEAATDNVFKRIVAILPAGWQYPEDCEARIHFDGKEYTTAGYRESDIKQVAEFKLSDNRIGFVEVVYTSEKPAAYEGCFLKEERDLINTITSTITVYFNKAAQQRTIKESESRFRSAFEDSAIGMGIVSLEGKWIKVNKSLCDMLGYTEEELLSLSFPEITHPEDLQADLDFLHDTIHGNRNQYRIEKRYFHKNGNVIWINLNVAPVRDSDDRPLYFVSQIENITDKKKITEQLLENQHKLRLFVEHSPASLAMFDMNMNYILTSKRWITDYNLTGKDLTGKNHYDIFPTIPQRWKDIHERCLAGNSEKCEEDSFTTENGTLAWLSWEIHPWYKASGEIGGIIMFTEVITDRVETRLKYQTLVEKSLVGVYIIKDGKFIYVNPRMVEQSGYTEEELLSIDFKDFLHPDYYQLVHEKMAARLKGEMQDSRYELKILNKKGKELWLDVMGTTTTYNGYPAIMGTMVNITDKKNFELERQKIIHNLAERNRDLEQFSNILSHNLRAPISTILGLADLFDENQDAAEMMTTVKGIESSAKQLDNVIRDLNEILSVKHSLTEIKTDVAFETLVDETMAILADNIRDKGAVIECDFSQVPKINTVRSYMSSIIYNIVSNSLKYTAENVKPVIQIKTLYNDGNIILVMNDNGIGMDLDKHKDQLFGLYKRFHHHIEGKGLGLFIVKTQVEALNGSIDVYSVPGEGTEFRLSFGEF